VSVVVIFVQERRRYLEGSCSMRSRLAIATFTDVVKWAVPKGKNLTDAVIVAVSLALLITAGLFSVQSPAPLPETLNQAHTRASRAPSVPPSL